MMRKNIRQIQTKVVQALTQGPAVFFFGQKVFPVVQPSIEINTEYVVTTWH